MPRFRGKVDAVSVGVAAGKVLMSGLIDLATGAAPEEGSEGLFFLWLDIPPPDPVASQTLLDRSLWVSLCEKALEHPAGRDTGLELVVVTALDTSQMVQQLALAAVGADVSALEPDLSGFRF